MDNCTPPYSSIRLPYHYVYKNKPKYFVEFLFIRVLCSQDAGTVAWYSVGVPKIIINCHDVEIVVR